MELKIKSGEQKWAEVWEKIKTFPSENYQENQESRQPKGE